MKKGKQMPGHIQVFAEVHFTDEICFKIPVKWLKTVSSEDPIQQPVELLFHFFILVVSSHPASD
jgi:hypothetical protein